jgi:hypothetical protein
MTPPERKGLDYEHFCKKGHFHPPEKQNTNVRKVGLYTRFDRYKSSFKFNSMFHEYIVTQVPKYNSYKIDKNEGLNFGNEELLKYIPAANNLDAFMLQLSYLDYDIKHDLHVEDWKKSLEYVERLYEFEFANSSVASYEEIYNYVIERGMEEKSPGAHFKESFEDKGSMYQDEQLMEAVVENFKDPRGGLTFWSYYLKDELRDAIKVKANKTRLFDCASATLQYMCMRMALKLQLSVFDSYKTKPIVSKLSKAYGGWNNLISRIGDKNVHATDGSRWDKRIRPSFILDFFNMLAKYVCNSNEDYNIWINICREHLVRNTLGLDSNVYEIRTGFPSGSYFTMLFNSLHHVRIFAYCYLQKCRLMRLQGSFEEFSRLKFAVCGDDNIFNNQFIDNKFYEKCVKSLFDVEYMNGNDVYTLPFLGAYTRKVDGYFIPVTDPVKQFFSAFWIKNDSVEAVYGKVASLSLNCAFGMIGENGKTYYELLYGFKNYLEDRFPELLRFENCWFNQKRAFLYYTYLDLSLNDSQITYRVNESGRNKVSYKKLLNSYINQNFDGKKEGKEKCSEDPQKGSSES